MSSGTVQGLKAVFEARSRPSLILTLPAESTIADTNKLASPKNLTLKPSIDAVLDSVKPVPPSANTITSPNALNPQPQPSLATSAPSRPTLSLRPSWIGPPRSNHPPTPNIVTMKQPVTIEYIAPGLQPPVYVFTSLSDPQWSEVEMDKELKDDGDYRFFKTFSADEGDYQYKFRLGPGDWWALDETKPKVDDGMGNKNNLMTVTAGKPNLTPLRSQSAYTAAADTKKETSIQPLTSLPPPQEVAPSTVQSQARPDVAQHSQQKVADEPKAHNQPIAPSPALKAKAEPLTEQRTAISASEKPAQQIETAQQESKSQQSQQGTSWKAEPPPAMSLPPLAMQPDATTTPAPAPFMAHEMAPTALAFPNYAAWQQPKVSPEPAPLMKDEIPAQEAEDEKKQGEASEWDKNDGDEETHEHEEQPEAVRAIPYKQDESPAGEHEDAGVEDDKEGEGEEEEGHIDEKPEAAHTLPHEQNEPPPEEDEDDDEDDEASMSPLLRHESFNPNSVEQTHAPLLQHESGGIGEYYDEYFRRAYSGEDSFVAEEADPNDPTLEKFPTDQASIYEHIRRTSSQRFLFTGIREDEEADEQEALASPLHGPQSLPSVQEDENEDEDLDIHREQEQQEAEEHAPRDEAGPGAADQEVVPMVVLTDPQGHRPAALITPPLTPKEAHAEPDEDAPTAEQVVEPKDAGIVAADAAEDKSLDQPTTPQAEPRGNAEKASGPALYPLAWLAAIGIAIAIASGLLQMRYR